METIRISICGNQASVDKIHLITSGTIGLPVEFSFDEQWEGLSKTAVFKAGNTIRDQLNIDTQTTVPAGVLYKARKQLEIGVYGTNEDGTIVVPTVWVTVGHIFPGADPSGDESADPTLPVWGQILKEVNEIRTKVAGKENAKNRVTIIDETADDEHYPSAKAVYDAICTVGTDVPRSEKYFDIDYDGVVSLKPEYQADGANNAELPEIIVIPDVINGTAVSALAASMFEKNLRVKSVTIPSYITAIPAKFANKAYNLTEINGTENIEVIDGAAFQMTNIRKALFPNLKRFDNPYQFYAAPNLYIVDIGNTVTEIPQNCFGACESLSFFKGGESVTSMAKNSFFATRSLKNLPIVKNVKTMGDTAFQLSRVSYDWWTFKTSSGCTFGANATPAHFNPSAWWSGCTYEVCENPLGSVFHQKNPEWADVQIPNSSDTYGSGCIETSAAHIYSALTGVLFDSPRYFVENIVGGIDDGRLLSPSGTEGGEPAYTFDDMANWLTELGMECESLTGYTSANLQKIYDALADGALVLTGINPNHAGVIYGVADNGEMLVLDSAPYQYIIGKYEAKTFQQRIWSIVTAGTAAVIVKKKEG